MNLPPAAPSARSVVFVGHVCIDENTGVDEQGLSQRVPGSPAFFMNRQLQSAPGVRVGIIAPHGSDFLEVGATLPLLNAPGPGGTLLYRNHIVGDVRSQECFNAQFAEPEPITVAHAQVLARADVVVVCPLLPNFGADYLDSVLGPVSASQNTLTVLVVQGYLRTVGTDGTVGKRAFSEYANVVPRFDLAVFSDEDLDDALEVAANWSAEFPQTTIVVTQNRRGATWFAAGSSGSVAAYPLERLGVGSVIGAGDVFSAALAMGYEQSRDIRSAVEHANAAAAAFIDGARVAALS